MQQNWVTVILEIIIVIVGIFLGLEVSEWNDHRKDRASEKDLLNEVIIESETALEVLKNYQAEHQAYLTSGTDFIRLITDKSKCQVTAEQMTTGIISLSSFHPINFNFVVLDRATQNGRIELIRNTEIKKKIALAQNELERIKEQWNRYLHIKREANYIAFKTAGAVYTSQFEIDLINMDWNKTGITYMDQSSLCGNKEVIGLLSTSALTSNAYIAYLQVSYDMLLNYHNSVVAYNNQINNNE
jgi:hypothetical protein